MKHLTLLLFSVLASQSVADNRIEALITSTKAAFPELPRVTVVADIGTVCGGGATAPGVYCSTERRIFLSQEAITKDDGPYVLAHLYGHAAQVTYGVADIALAAIRSDPAREDELRGMVTRQVECLAGVFVSRAGLTVPDLTHIHDEEPFTGSHWGRNPVRTGPRVSIGLEARAEWFAIGANARSPAACTVGQMETDLIVARDRSANLQD